MAGSPAPAPSDRFPPQVEGVDDPKDEPLEPETPEEAYASLPTALEDLPGRIFELRELGQDRQFRMAVRARWLREARKLREQLESSDPAAGAEVRQSIIGDPLTAA